MTESEEIDRELEWLLRQRDNGLTHGQIAALGRWRSQRDHKKPEHH